MYEKNIAKIKKIKRVRYIGKVYNFSVVDDHTYVAGGCLVSNCHEQSNREGKHGDLSLIESLWSKQLPGTEMAIGGGNPLAHPEIIPFLRKLRSYHIIPNITVNMMHMKKFSRMIKDMQREKLIFGLGISYRGEKSLNLLPENIDYSNVVFHMIMGVHTLQDCHEVIEWCKYRNITPKILLLGYKTFGNGISYYSPQLQKELDDWKNSHLNSLLNCEDELVLSFDNLAISQLDLENKLDKDTWNNLFQGLDGSHTFYIDAVKQEVSRTSTSNERYKYSGDEDIRKLFGLVKIRKEETL